MSDTPALVIGSSTADHLSLRPVQRAHPDASDYWDGNWLKTEVSVRAGAFRGSLVVDLRADEFDRFHKQLSALNETLRGEATFETMESWIFVRVRADRLGHLETECEVLDDPGMGNRLSFVLHLDQTYLPAMLGSLAGITRTFPVMGRPAE